MTVELSDLCAEDVEEIVVAWLSPLRRTAAARQAGDPLPFTLVTNLGGPEDGDLKLATPLVSVHTLCDKALGIDAAQREAKLTHRRMLYLGRYRDPVTMNDGRQVSVDFLSVFQSPIWVLFDDSQILRKVARYSVGLSFVPVI